ncbi:MAG: flagellar hook-length control protein FliK [Paracoccaceae bacterium]
MPFPVTNLAQTFGSDRTTPHIKAFSALTSESQGGRLLDSFQHVETTQAVADLTSTTAIHSNALPSAPLQTRFAAGTHAASAHALPKTISSAVAKAATDPEHHNIELTLAPLTTLSIHRNTPPSPMPQTAFVSDAHTASTHALPRTISTAVVKAASGADHDKVELTLDPIELGRVRFALITAGHQLQVTLSVERPETLDLLRRHADDLRAEFRAAGFDAASLSFGHWGQNKSDDQPQTATEFTEPADVSPPQAAPRMRAASTGLDLLL